MITCTQSLNFNIWKETVPFFHIPPFFFQSDIGEIGCPEVECLKVTKLANDRAGLQSKFREP